ncbi:hypothetical protein [Spiroplasma poulsonii]|uniref:hypothetical protein n=1 Tax=Spiroplasma poulsonii TaxID=2138 RepID=UPI001F4CC51B|nr:hypothetical protein [Spiroplasma poulsonii]UNF61652.1 hypothetical protein MNU24_07000 [Spiroplasma poulsonii]
MLKPSENATISKVDEPIDYSIDSIPLDFVNQSQYSDPDLEQLFHRNMLEPVYIYIKLTIVKHKGKPTLN